MDQKNIPTHGLTHSGKFHADDVFSTALLELLNPEFQVKRVLEVPEDFDGIVYDIGGGAFDHHQTGAPVRENGIPYAAFGLLWREYGPSLVGEEEASRLDESWIQPLDLEDNTGCGHPLAEAIGGFNPLWDSPDTPDDRFPSAVAFAKVILQHKLEEIWGIQRAKSLVEEALGSMKDRIVLLPRFSPWKMSLPKSEALFVVYPSQRGGYSAQGVPDPESGELKCPFPQDWAGKRDHELARLTGLATLRFCHNSRFLIAADSLEDILAACRIAQRTNT